jgi:hypothetical protein
MALLNLAVLVRRYRDEREILRTRSGAGSLAGAPRIHYRRLIVGEE